MSPRPRRRGGQHRSGGAPAPDPPVVGLEGTHGVGGPGVLAWGGPGQVAGGERDPRAPATRLIAAQPGWISPPDILCIRNKCHLSRELIQAGPQPSISAGAGTP